MIYFLQHGNFGVIKIGQTNGFIAGRIRAVQAASPEQLVFLGAHEGGLEEEQALHRRFKALNYRGEWFKPSREIFEHIANNCTVTDFNELTRADLRFAVCAGQKKHWPKNIKAEYAPRDHDAGNTFWRWQEGSGELGDDCVEYIETFLRKYDMFPATTPKSVGAGQ